MTDSHPPQSIEWLDWYNQQYGPPQKDPAAVPRLTRAIADYLNWMKSVNYTAASQHLHRTQLELFLNFVKNQHLHWQQLFSVNTREHFKNTSKLRTTAAVNALSRYLVEKGHIKMPLPQQPSPRKLAGIFEEYLQFRQDNRQTNVRQLNPIRRVLSALCDYFNQHGISPARLRIEQLDAFMAEFCLPFLPGTCRNYRTIVRGFLAYLYQQRGILKKDLAPLLIGAAQFAKAKPPKFLRPHEVKLLFESLSVNSAKELRTYVMVHLAYTLGLRPCEICRITLDDIAFKKAQLNVEDRKNKQPLTLPILSFHAPYGPIVPGLVGRYIQEAMHKAGLSSTPYWLRHSYAQHLLSSGASIYEIKQMLGHRHIESSRKYLHIHIDLMREVILDEPL
jgi:site-specific recombinase XerD